jgi:hypothetical protein
VHNRQTQSETVLCQPLAQTLNIQWWTRQQQSLLSWTFLPVKEMSKKQIKYEGNNYWVVGVIIMKATLHYLQPPCMTEVHVPGVLWMGGPLASSHLLEEQQKGWVSHTSRGISSTAQNPPGQWHPKWLLLTVVFTLLYTQLLESFWSWHFIHFMHKTIFKVFAYTNLCSSFRIQFYFLLLEACGS